MESKTRKFLEILKIELEDLIFDLEFSEKVLTKRLQDHEITEYVFLENASLLKREILGIEEIKKMLYKSNKTVTSVADLRETIENYFKDKIKSAGLPDVVFLLVSRKLEKVSRYMAIDD